MLNTVYNVVFLLFGVYLIYGGFIGKKLSDKENGENMTLFISLMVNGGLIILYSVYKIYQSFKGV